MAAIMGQTENIFPFAPSIMQQWPPQQQVVVQSMRARFRSEAIEGEMPADRDPRRIHAAQRRPMLIL